MLFECEPRGLSRRSSHSPCIKVTNVSIEAFRIGSRVLVPVSPHHFDPSFFNRFNIRKDTTGELARNCAAIRSFKMDALSLSSKSTVEKVKIVPPFDDITYF